MSNLPAVTLAAKDPETQLKALQQSRLAALIQDKGLLHRIYEAAVNLLTDEKLRACDESSIMGALYKAASLGFRLERDFGECYLIPRKMGERQVCCFQIGYKGWKAIALQSGNVQFIESREVYKEDLFDFEYGSGAYLKHRPADESAGMTTHFYARARLANGAELFEVITKQAAEKSRRHSESQYDGYGKEKKFSDKPKDIWAKHYAAMALRVPIKKLCAALPMTPALEAAAATDGTVTYLQKDGTVTTITAVDVEKQVEQIEESKIPAAQLNEYENLQDGLAGLQSMDHLIKFWNDYKTGENGKNEVFVTLFFERAAVLATTEKDLADFYNAAIAWKANTKLVAILTARKAKLEKDAQPA